MSLPAYPTYKDSGVPWLGLVPKHWEVKKLKDAARIINGYPFDSDLFDSSEGHPLIRIRDINGTQTEVCYKGDFIEAARVEEGDILVGMDGDFNVATWSGPVALLNQRVCKVQPIAMNGGFLAYSIPTPLKIINDLTYFTTVKHLSSKDVGQIRIPRPPLAEQQAIAAWLDERTGRIDEAVAAQRALLDTLKEKRRALIAHAVTRGLDPAAPLRDSGIPWLGMVPAHWEVKPLKHLVSFESGGTPNKATVAYWDGDIPWASAKDLKTEVLFDTEDHITQTAVDDKAASLVRAGSVLTVVRGMILAHTLPVTVAAVPMAINQDLKAITATGEVMEPFLPWLLRGSSAETLRRVDEAGHGTKALRQEAWISMPLPVPPLAEQQAIVAHLDAETAKLDELAAETERAVTLLLEHRTALIAEAVTGKLRVPGA